MGSGFGNFDEAFVSADGGLSGFQPATIPSQGFGSVGGMTFPSDNFGPMGGMNAQGSEDFLDDEERERVMNVEAQNE